VDFWFYLFFSCPFSGAAYRLLFRPGPAGKGPEMIVAFLLAWHDALSVLSLKGGFDESW
jgi:hypothetical protein